MRPRGELDHVARVRRIQRFTQSRVVGSDAENRVDTDDETSSEPVDEKQN